MKTLLLTIATTASAMIFSSCGCCDSSNSQCGVKHYDSRGRLIKEVSPSGNYNTYYYDGEEPDKKPCSRKHTKTVQSKNVVDDSWTPEPASDDSWVSEPAKVNSWEPKPAKDTSWMPRLP